MNSPGFITYVSKEAYYLFSDSEWNALLIGRGADLSRAIRYSVSPYGVCIYYNDTFIGEGI